MAQKKMVIINFIIHNYFLDIKMNIFEETESTKDTVAKPEEPIKDKKPDETVENVSAADLPQLSLGEIASIEKNIASSKVDSLQALHNVSFYQFFCSI